MAEAPTINLPSTTPSTTSPTIPQTNQFNVKPRRPTISITIVDREFNGASLNFTTDQSTGSPFNDLMQVSTSRNMQDIAGQFALTLTARRDNQGRTWAHKIAPMAYVEIKMAENPNNNLPGDQALRTIMRGFVASAILGMSEVGGRPQMAVVIQGFDYGKLFSQANLFVIANGGQLTILTPSSNVQDAGPFFNYSWGLTGSPNFYLLSPHEFIEAIVGQKGILANYISLSDAPLLINGARDNDFPDAFKVPMASATASLGSLQNLLDAFKSNPWYEMYIRDDPASSVSGSTLVWRLSPYLKADGSPIKLSGTGPDENAYLNPISVGMKDIVEMQVGVSDDTQYSYFMTLPTAYSASSTDLFTTFGQPQPRGAAIWDYSDWRQFGFRPMEQLFPLLPLAINQNRTDTDTQTKDWMQIVKDLNQWLSDAYSDQYTLENGTITVKGSELFEIGIYILITETQQKFYVQAVEHGFTIDQPSWQTTLTVVRGRWPQDKSPYRVLPKSNPPPGGATPAATSGSEAAAVTTQPTPGSTPTPPTQGGLPSTPPGTTQPSVTPSASGFICPLPGAIITQPYGVAELGVGAPHTGTDFGYQGGNTCGAAIQAVADGTVVFSGVVGTDQVEGNIGTGNTVKIQHPNGLVTVYGHMMAPSPLSVGDHVTQGETIGLVGDTGYSRGCHLHFEVHTQWDPNQQGKYLVDPVNYVSCAG
jgi:murein DD-endopeptidase MepM/ murein hydrolase activator NlpD